MPFDYSKNDYRKRILLEATNNLRAKKAQIHKGKIRHREEKKIPEATNKLLKVLQKQKEQCSC